MGEWVGLGIKVGFKHCLGVWIIYLMIYLINKGFGIKLNRFEDLFNLIEE